jgi:hypothetical protein
MIKCELSANRRQVIELHSRVLGEAFGQIICKRLQLSRIPCENERLAAFSTESGESCRRLPKDWTHLR